MHVESSLRRRYAAKLAANLLGLGVNFINVSLLPRALGPANYGSYDFLTSFFQNMTNVWDANTSTAFFTQLSGRNNDAGLLWFYARYTIGVGIAIVVAVGATAVAGLNDWFWPGQAWVHISLAAAVGYVLWVSETLRKTTDAFGLTVAGELSGLVIRLAGALVTVFLFQLSWLNLPAWFVKELGVYAAITLALWAINARHWQRHITHAAVRTSNSELYAEFYTYCSPLIVYSLLGVVASIVDRWMLQRFAGSAEQGFFGLSNRMGTVCLLFSMAMTQLLQREFSRAHEATDKEELRRLFSRFIPLLYSITVYFAAFASAQSDNIVVLFGGSAFADAAPTTMLMMLYPIHTTYGQLSGSLLLATRQTQLFRNIGIGFMLAGIVATWFVLAPASYGGIAAGSEGLAIKMIVSQFTIVNVQLYFNTRYLDLSFSRFLKHQFIVVGLYLLFAWAAVWAMAYTGAGTIPGLCGSLAIYSIMVGVVLRFWPGLAGLSTTDVDLLLRQGGRKFIGRWGRE